jgi:hypothetical protein
MSFPIDNGRVTNDVTLDWRMRKKPLFLFPRERRKRGWGDG